MIDGHLDRNELLEFDTLGETERRVVIRHLADCRACREIWSQEDPARLFALLGSEAPPAAALDRLTDRIHDELDAVEARPPAERRHGRGWASLAASLVLAGVVGGYLLSRPEVDRGSAIAGLAEQTGETFAGSGIEVMTPSDAEVYDLTVGDTQIVMIFDERLDI